MKYPALILFIIMVICYLIRQHLRHQPQHNRAVEIIFKCAATSMAAILALLGCLKGGSAADWVLFAALVVGTIADCIICLHFTAGGAVFALGHMLYIIAFGIMNRPGWSSVLLFLCLMGAITSGFTLYKKRLGRRLPFFYAYATIISLMVAFSVAQPPLFLAGAMFFTFSDGLLLYLMIDRRHVYLDYISLGTYYLGQFMLALASVLY